MIQPSLRQASTNTTTGGLFCIQVPLGQTQDFGFGTAEKLCSMSAYLLYISCEGLFVYYCFLRSILVLYPGFWAIQNHPQTRIKHRPQRPNRDEYNERKITEDAEQQHTTHYTAFSTPKPESSTENPLSFSRCWCSIPCRPSDKKPRYSFESCFLFEEGCFLHYL